MKNPILEGKKILIVQPLNRAGRPTGKPLIALDVVGAGAGETIYWCRGREASYAWYPDEVPTEATIVAIVDSVDVPGKAAADTHSAGGASHGQKPVG